MRSERKLQSLTNPFCYRYRDRISTSMVSGTIDLVSVSSMAFWKGPIVWESLQALCLYGSEASNSTFGI